MIYNWLVSFAVLSIGVAWLGGSAMLFAQGVSMNINTNNPAWKWFVLAGLFGAVTLMATVSTFVLHF